MEEQLLIPSNLDGEQAAHIADVLASTGLLDSTISDTGFDNYSRLARRMFKTSIAIISFADYNRLWFKSRIGTTLEEIPICDSFCAQTILPHCSDVFVVLDTSKDPRFANHPLVTGPPYIRFYAGSALVVAHTKVGALCVLDSESRDEFTMDERMNLFDLSMAVSSLMQEKRDALANADKLRANSMLDITRRLRQPLMAMSRTLDHLENERERIAEAIAVTRLSSHEDFMESIDELTDEMYRVNVIMDSHIFMGNTTLPSNIESNGSIVSRMVSNGGLGSKKISKSKSTVKCSIIKTLAKAKEVIGAIDVAGCIRWDINCDQLKETLQHSYPDEIAHSLVVTVEQMLAHFLSLSVEVTFVIDSSKSTIEAEDGQGKLLSSNAVMGKLFARLSGKHVSDNVTTSASGRTRITAGSVPNSSEVSPISPRTAMRTTRGLLDVHLSTAQRTIRSVGGEFMLENKSENLFVEMWVPCIDLSPPLVRSEEPPGEVQVVESGSTMAPVSTYGLISSNSVLERRIQALVIDDCPVMRKWTKRLLEQQGCVVQVAENGVSALHIMLSSSFDICFVDYLMPIMSGPEFVHEYTTRNTVAGSVKVNKDMLMIGISASNGFLDKETSVSPGIHFFASKPIAMNVVSTILSIKRTYPKLIDAIENIADEFRGDSRLMCYTQHGKFPSKNELLAKTARMNVNESSKKYDQVGGVAPVSSCESGDVRPKVSDTNPVVRSTNDEKPKPKPAAMSLLNSLFYFTSSFRTKSKSYPRVEPEP